MAASHLPTSIRCLIQADRSRETVSSTRIPIELPLEGSYEHLIKVKCVAPCASELTWAKTDSHLMDPERVDVPCFDMTGIVIQAPAGSPFEPGAEVFAHTNAFTTGNAREYSIARTSELATRPNNLSWEEATTIPLSALTAYQALFEHGHLVPGWKNKDAQAANASKTVMITAGAGGVGSLAVQLAKAAGVGEIMAIAGTSNVDFVKSLGATQVVDYRKVYLGMWAAARKAKVDLVVDLVGGQTLTDAWSMVKPGGTVVSVVERDPRLFKPVKASANIESKFFILKSRGYELEEITTLVESNQIRPVVDSVWEFDQYSEAFAKLKAGHARGKVVIRLP